MNFAEVVSVIKVWEDKVFEKYPLKTILAICIIICIIGILYRLDTVSSGIQSIEWDVSSVQSDVSSIQYDVSSIESEVSSIESRLPY